MSEPLGHGTHRSVRRSTKRELAIVMLSSMGEAHPRMLALAIDVDVTRLHHVMQGHPPDYSRELAPVTLGLARLERTPAGRKYVITEKGRKKARQLTSRRVRDAAAKRARAAAAGKAPPQEPAPAPVPTGVPTAAPGWSYGCTYTWP